MACMPALRALYKQLIEVGIIFAMLYIYGISNQISAECNGQICKASINPNFSHMHMPLAEILYYSKTI